MKKLSFITIALAVTGLVTLSHCNREPQVLKELVPQLPSTPDAYQNMFMGGDNTPANNTMTDHGATLGRVLFYDTRLSVNNTVSCASCHKQQFAFADNETTSLGFEGVRTSRNTPAIINASSKSSFFWDGRVSSLESQTLLPVRNHIEMGLESHSVLVKKLEKTTFYPELFEKAFGSREITAERVSKALAQFTRSIVSVRSKFDNATLTQQENEGLALFLGKAKCANCHLGQNVGGASLVSPYQGEAITTPNVSNIGLDETYADGGLEELTKKASDNGFFVIPSLRNIELTAPYMHDGRFKTLEEVIEHYNSGIKSHPNLDPILTEDGGSGSSTPVVSVTPVHLNLTVQEKQSLLAFLKTLTDKSITSDKRYSNPFK